MSKKHTSAVNAGRAAGIKRVFAAAFPYTIPILAGYGCLGFALGILMSAAGFSPVITVAMSLVVFAGSGQFVAVRLLTAFNPLGAFLLEIMVNARHVFYGISMLGKYKGAGRKKWYMIMGLTDETFSINYSAEPPEGAGRAPFMFAVTLLNHCYWVIATGLGAVFGSFVHFNTDGLEFVMTALFIVIFTEQWLKEKSHISAILGIILSAVCLLVFGAEKFLVPSMLAIFLALAALRRPIERGAAS